MLLLAFPASEGSLCCLGTGDWPLDPHEILLHPQDLEKLRVPAFGHVSIHRNRSSSSTGNSSSGRRRPRAAIGRGQEAEHGTAQPRGRENDEAPLTFCRAIPDDSLSPGETRAPAWLLGAANVRPRQHLLVNRAPEVAEAGEGMAVPGAPAAGGQQQRSPSNFRVSVSLVASEQSLAGEGKDTAPSGHRTSPSAADIKARAIARRVSGCMVGFGSLLAAEVLGKTVVLKVVAITDRPVDNDNDNGSNSNGDVVDANATPLQTFFLITSLSQVALVGRANETESGSSSLLPQTGVASSPPVSPAAAGEHTRHRRRRSTRHCGGGQQGEEAWARRAPGLEAALAELQALVLLSVVGSGGSGSSGSRSSSWTDVLPAGIVLCGPSGVGKTLALDLLAEDLREAHGVHVVRLLGPQILSGLGQGGGGSGVPGEKAAASPSPLLLHGPLGQSLAEARARAPSVIVLDELDALFDACGGGDGDEGGGWGGADPLGEGVRANEALLEMLDRASATEGVAVLGATRRSPAGRGGAGWTELDTGGGGGGLGDGAALPAAFRKPGRFDRCVTVGPPTQAQRERILRVLLSSSSPSSPAPAADGAPGWELESLGGAPAAAADDDSSPAGEAAPRVGAGPELSKVPSSSSLGESGGLQGPDPESLHAAEPREGRENGPGRGGGESPESGEAERRRTTTRRGEKGGTRETRAAAAAAAAAESNLAEWAKRLSSVTPGMVGGDLERLVRTARARSARCRRERRSAEGRVPPPPPPPSTLAWRDAMGAVAVTVPRSLRGLDVASSSRGGGDGAGGGSGGAPTWASVGGFSEAKRRLQRLVQWPWLHPEAFARLGVSAPAGALLHGPSGCGKSLVAQVLAAECLANFLWVRSSELLSRYLGETEAKLRALFSRARAAAPCILFLDELDAITAKRGDGGGGGGGEGSGGAGSVHARVLSTLLNEMDGVASTSSSSGGGTAAGGGRDAGGGGVLVLAATNRREALDAALLRPGRLHESVELGVPGREDREGVLRVHAARLPLAAGVDLARLSRDDVSGGLTCADLEASCRDAAMMAVREDLRGAREVRPEHLRKALEDRVAGRLRTRRFTFSVGQGPSGAA